MPRRAAIFPILTFTAAAVATGHAAAQPRPMGYPQTIEALARCGIPAGKVRTRDDAELQLVIVSIDSLAQAPSDEVLICVHRATVPAGYHVEFQDAEQNAAFLTLVMDERRRRAGLEGRQWLGRRGLMNGMPLFRAGETELSAFVRAVEAHCSIAPGSAIEVLGSTSVTLRPQFVRSIAGSADGAAKLTCLTNVMAASNLADGGVAFGIVAHEAISSRPESR